jgi:hypothetical protein
LSQHLPHGQLRDEDEPIEVGRDHGAKFFGGILVNGFEE